jgi:hypothetical protein
VTVRTSPGFASERVTACPGATSPVSVTATLTAGPLDTLPPTSATANSSQASRIPPKSSIVQAASTSALSVSDESANRGDAAIAATSLTAAATAL